MTFRTRFWVRLFLFVNLSGLIVIYHLDPDMGWRAIRFYALPFIFLFLFISFIPDRSISHAFFPRLQGTRPILVLISLGITFSTFILLSNSARPLLFFFLFGILITFTAFLAVGTQSNRYLIICLTSILMLLFTYSVTLRYPLFFGWSDIPLHLNYSQVTYQLHSITPATLSPNYHQSPLFHVFTATIAHILGISVKSAYFAIIPIPVVSTVFFVYTITRNFSSSTLLPRLSIVLYSILPLVLFYSQYAITRVYGYIAFLILFYLISTNKPDWRSILLAVFFIVYLLYIHSISVPLILILLVTYVVIDMIYTEQSQLRTGYGFCVILTAATMYMIHLVYGGRGFLLSIASRVALISHSGLFLGGNTESSGSSLNVDFVVEMITLMDANLILFFGFLGSIYMIVHGQSSEDTTPRGEQMIKLGIFCLLATFIYIPNPLQAFPALNEILRIDRFELLVAPFVAIATAYALLTFQGSIHRKLPHFGTPTASVILLLFIFVFAIIGGLSPINSSDVKELDQGSQEMYFNEGEIHSTKFLYKHTHSGDYIISDTYIRKHLQQEFSQSHKLKGKYYKLDVQDNISDLIVKRGYLLFREGEYDRTGIYFGQSQEVTVYSGKEDRAESAKVFLEQNNQIYHNSEASLHVGRREK